MLRFLAISWNARFETRAISEKGIWRDRLSLRHVVAVVSSAAGARRSSVAACLVRSGHWGTWSPLFRAEMIG